jgi:hypothetical protein
MRAPHCRRNLAKHALSLQIIAFRATGRNGNKTGEYGRSGPPRNRGYTTHTCCGSPPTRVRDRRLALSASPTSPQSRPCSYTYKISCRRQLRLRSSPSSPCCSRWRCFTSRWYAQSTSDQRIAPEREDPAASCRPRRRLTSRPPYFRGVSVLSVKSKSSANTTFAYLSGYASVRQRLVAPVVKLSVIGRPLDYSRRTS